MEKGAGLSYQVCTIIVRAWKIIKLIHTYIKMIIDVIIQRRKCKGDLASTVECYISEYNVTSEVAIIKIVALIEQEWKTLNQARFENHLLPALQQFISLAISTTFFYGNRNDVYTHNTHMQWTIERLFLKNM